MLSSDKLDSGANLYLPMYPVDHRGCGVEVQESTMRSPAGPAIRRPSNMFPEAALVAVRVGWRP